MTSAASRHDDVWPDEAASWGLSVAAGTMGDDATKQHDVTKQHDDETNEGSM